MAQAQPQPSTGQMLPGQLPVKGINARDALMQMGPQDAINLVNFLSSDEGLTLRGGYQVHADNLPGSVEVETLMSYYPATAGPSLALGVASTSALKRARLVRPRAIVTLFGQLFACTNSRIYDVTAGGPGPWTPLLAADAASDFWTWVNFQNAAGSFLLATNNLGGYVIYNGAGDFEPVVMGVGVGEISGIDPDLFVFVMVWKNRLWFIEQDSTRSWYLPTGQITGVATEFDWGAHFKHGGRLATLFNWTLDGGEGIDDHLVALSDQGDIVIFKGYDPDSAGTDPNAFQLHGIWYLGAVPIGRRHVTLYGGDAYILSVYGITQLSKLVSNAQVAANLVEDVSSRIDPLISQLMQGNTGTAGWYINFLPGEQLMILGVPQQLTGEGLTQLAMVIRRQAWSRFFDLPVSTMISHDALAFGGGTAAGGVVNGAGKVYLLFANALDNVPLALPQGNLIRGRVVPSFNPFGTPGQWKIFPMVRPIIRSPQTPSIRLRVLTDFTDSEFFSVPTLPVLTPSLWDVDLWDVGLWGGFFKPTRKWLGTTGCGFSATVQLDIVGPGNLSLMSIDWWTVPGGPL